MYKTQTRKKRNFSNSKRKPSRRNQQSNQKVDISRFTNKGSVNNERKAYVNKHTFEDFELDNKLLAKIKEKGFKLPSEIQDKTILPALEGKDIVGIAGTGTGKTSAFLIPIIQHMIEHKQANYALIIAPTRELATQINDEFLTLARGLNIFSTCLIGGSSVGENIKALKRTNHFIIGTPGRIGDMMKRRLLKLDDFSVLVLDEFDRMLDMGFSKEIQQINKEMKSKDQTLLFSATLDPTQKKLVEEMTNDPINVKAEQSTQDTNAIEQEVCHVKGQDKIQLVKNLIDSELKTRTILFSETKRKAEQISELLKKSGIAADAIHGDKSQRAREIALSKFKRGQVHVLVATDVVARGIDVKDVELVINYEAPRNYTDYVHRIGRTGRAGKTGRAVTLID
ncbi:MAG: DEAD/DEAH box helicase [Ekhidna sp.]|uniref:DEAD/DEAH box helicase n=1 Tax=Ekhidna sp. TaxID=2608089 RepID=UPI0032ECDBBD